MKIATILVWASVATTTLTFMRHGHSEDANTSNIVAAGKKEIVGNEKPKGNSKALLGAPDFQPALERPIGWRGDGTGHYPGANPPITWERVVTGPLGHGLQQASKPKGDLPGPEAVDLTPGNALFSKWLILGPFPSDADPAAALTKETVPGEANLSAEEGVKVKDQEWKTGWFTDPEGKANGFWTAPNQVAYAHTYLYFQEAGTLDLAVQHEGGMKVWVNGKSIHENPVPYKYTYGRNNGHWVTASVAKGWNHLLCKLTHAERESWCGVMAMPTKDASYATKNIMWSVPMPNFSNSTPLIVGERLFTTAEPNDLICLDKKSGKILWIRNTLAYYAAVEDKFAGINLEEKRADVAKLEALNEAIVKNGTSDPKIRASFQERSKLATMLQDWIGKTKEYNYHCPGWGGGNSAPTPCTDGQYVYVWHGEAGLLGCYGLDGTRQWVRYIHPLGPGEGSHHGVNGSPVITGDRIVIPGWGCFLGVERATGKLLWRSKYNGVAYSTHVVTRIGNTDAIILPTGRIMQPGDGTILTPDFKGRYDGECQSTAIDRERNLFAVMSWGEMSIARIPQDPSKKEVQVVGKIAAPGKDGRIDDNYNVSSPLFDNGLLYYSSTRGLFQVADAEAGTLIYKKRLPVYPATAYGPQGAGVGASLCKAGGNLYVLDNRGTSVVVAPGREFKLLAVNRIQDLNNSGDQQEVVQATPVFDGSYIYIRGYRNLYCIGEK